MQVQLFHCPNCGASLTVPPDTNSFFCTYCGSQICVDDGTIRIEITNRIIDEVRLKELELQEQNRIRKEQEEAEKKKKDKVKTTRWLIALIVWIIIGILLIMIAIDKRSEELDETWFMTYLIEECIISLILAFTIPKCSFKSGKPPSLITKFGIWWLLFIVSLFSSSLIGWFIGSVFGLF